MTSKGPFHLRQIYDSLNYCLCSAVAQQSCGAGACCVVCALSSELLRSSVDFHLMHSSVRIFLLEKHGIEMQHSCLLQFLRLLMRRKECLLQACLPLCV